MFNDGKVWPVSFALLCVIQLGMWEHITVIYFGVPGLQIQKKKKKIQKFKAGDSGKVTK